MEEYWYEETIRNLGNDDNYIMILLGLMTNLRKQM